MLLCKYGKDTISRIWHDDLRQSVVDLHGTPSNRIRCLCGRYEIYEFKVAMNFG